MLIRTGGSDVGYVARLRLAVLFLAARQARLRLRRLHFVRP